MIFQTNYSKAVLWVFFSLFVFHITAYALSLYYIIPWLDIVSHFWGGISVALFFVWFFYFSNRFSGVSREGWFFLLLILGCVSLVAVGWEFIEFITSRFVAEMQGNLPDTMGDLFMAQLGGLIVFMYFLPKIKNNGQEVK